VSKVRCRQTNLVELSTKAEENSGFYLGVNLTSLICVLIFTSQLPSLIAFQFSRLEEEINYLLYQEILPFFDIIDVQQGPQILEKDPRDDKFIRCALAANAIYIISGDQYLLTLKSYQKIKILPQADFINRL
jgi:predicted nucleic acid-binding protein